MKERLEEADFIKSVCIILMVIFHLAYIGDKYPLPKQFVYTFHMPAFLVLSGYFLNVRKNGRALFRSMWWLFVPYAVFEAAYVVMASFLPTRDAVSHLSAGLVLHKLFVDPLGPYWYLHTLIVASVVTYVLTRITRGLSDPFTRSLIVAAVLALLASFTGLVSLPNVLYYAGGYALAQMTVSLRSFFRPTLWAFLPLLLLLSDSAFWDKTTLGGVAIVYFMMSLLMALYPHLTGHLRSGALLVGRNTLPILVFSPVFTMGVKVLLPVFAFDHTGLLFLVVATAITLCGSLGLTWLMDRCHLSRYFWGRDVMLV